MRDVGASANANDEGENDRGLTANGHQNLIAQPGTQLSYRGHMNEHAAIEWTFCERQQNKLTRPSFVTCYSTCTDEEDWGEARYQLLFPTPHDEQAPTTNRATDIWAIRIDAELLSERTSLGQLDGSEAKIAAAITFADEVAAARA